MSTLHAPTQQVARVAWRALALYLVITFAWSWTLGALLIASARGALALPMALHYLSAYGPAVAAVTVTVAVGGRRDLKALGQRIVKADVGARLWLLTLGTPLALGGLAVAVYAALHGLEGAFSRFGDLEYLGRVGVPAALAVWLATYGFGEEIGWRGFAFHHLQRLGWVRAAVLVGVVWGLWHLPYFLYKPTFVALGPLGFVGFLASITLGSVLLGWFYRQSGGSILIVALWHGLFDFVSASPVAAGPGNAVISAAVIVWVLVIVRRARRAESASGAGEPN
ncbi:CPBP family intramembrane glutamic endopeptidase [Truepera radiovictrix]|uniref:Abortive infection protein n=1 Tax=Truepera radiovictrix (strain DSM 17093 / CIP 108686 / LMG 22925 / RQ-24) TaxID=649638 RepID=D7CVZ0_TRURR|nr:CPBP family intramembrane glutamic endopeptidase [Truepera radiovictrix]ADI14253.1 Abortive infection protein [Truepera radiovictrix DSM 17093]WMT57190.1 CPBP family intramembrane metalloprotease [Truepera radiovictrix]